VLLIAFINRIGQNGGLKKLRLSKIVYIF
jgi:hypothetical protein